MIDRFFGYRNWGILLFILVMVLAAYAGGLFVHVTRDASKYATIAREIATTGDLINLKVHGEPYVQKPPLLFWVSALSLRLFGMSDFGFKLPLLLFSLAGIYFTYRLGKSLYNRETGFLAALLVGSSQISFLYNMDIHTDTLLQSLVTFSLWQFHAFLKNGKNVSCCLGFLGMGMAMLTKGPVGAAVPATAVLGYLLSTGNYRRMADGRWYWGILVSLIIILPALAGLYNQFGMEGIRFYFWDNNVGRISGTLVGKDTNYFYYLYNLLYLCAPWMVLLVVALFLQFRSLFQKRMKGAGWFLFWGIWPYFLVISLAHGKLPNYLYMLVPLFSVVTARLLYIALFRKGEVLFRRLLGVQTGVALLTGAVLLAITLWLYPLRSLWQGALLTAFFVVVLLSVIRGGTRGTRLLVPSLAMITGLNFFINTHVAPPIFRDQASVEAATIFNNTAAPGDSMGNYNYFSHELFFYCKTPVRQVLNDLELFTRMGTPGNWVLTTGEVVDRMPRDQFPMPEITPLRHIWLNRLTWEYLHPRTRENAYDTLYLLRSTALAPGLSSPHPGSRQNEEHALTKSLE